MWFIIIISAVLVYFLFFHQAPQKGKHASSRRKKTNGQNISETNWKFACKIDDPNIPPIINAYRKKLSGYDYNKLVKELKTISTIEDEAQRNMAYLQYLEPLAELERKGLFEMNEDMPHFFFEHFIFELFQYLCDYYPAIGATGQIKNLEEIFHYIPETKGFLVDGKLRNSVYSELKARNEIIDKIKGEGFIYKKNLKELESFEQVALKEYLINRLIQYNQIEPDRKGRYIIYKLKES